MGLPLIVGHVGVQDPSYLNLHDNMTILSETEINAPRIGAEIRRLTGDLDLLAKRQAAALRAAAELLDYHVLVEQTLRVA